MTDITPELRDALHDAIRREVRTRAGDAGRSDAGQRDADDVARAQATARAELLYYVVREIRDDIDASDARCAPGERASLSTVTEAALHHLRQTSERAPQIAGPAGGMA
ncbi:MAG: hypothetical protein ABW040_10500 [Microbacteriaceae bacterium]